MLLILLFLSMEYPIQECTSAASTNSPDNVIDSLASKHIPGYIPLSTQSHYEKLETCNVKILTQTSVLLQMWTNIVDCYMFSVQDTEDTFTMDYGDWEEYYMNDSGSLPNGTIAVGHMIAELLPALTIQKLMEELIGEAHNINGKSAILSAGHLLKAHLAQVINRTREIIKSFENESSSLESYDYQPIFYELEYLMEEAAGTHNRMSGMLSSLHGLEELSTSDDVPKIVAASC
ncbi:hypothetical protein DdX_21973 [Ditylenchus destructor]|uniref:Exocyst complex component Sec8 n=1 Tax=Ditylenchus destructor TaxID=166010 RepID=A0AAD4MEW1_9BILA|nr:hypothetical protein DdX_21973 [Ditylenchus destructor]